MCMLLHMLHVYDLSSHEKVSNRDCSILVSFNGLQWYQKVYCHEINQCSKTSSSGYKP